jgi:hypothetical protein
MIAGTAAAPSLVVTAVRRWKLGHQVFHIQLVVMTTLFAEATLLMRGNDVARVCRVVGKLRSLFDAATANMVYASSFPPEMYTRLIRPSMAPPYVSPGFSGLLSREHAAMLRSWKQFREAAAEVLGPRRDRWPGELRQELAALQRAVEVNQQNHVRVCSRFVPAGGSLLSEFFAARTAPSSVRPQPDEEGKQDDQRAGSLAPQAGARGAGDRADAAHGRHGGTACPSASRVVRPRPVLPEPE